MRNFGLTEWTVVAPNPLLLDEPGARKLAVHSEELLSTARVVPSLAEAVADCTWLVGTSMRPVRGKRRLRPRAVAQRAFEHPGQVAVIFGDERSGMTANELASCHDVSSIPTDAAQPSLNLAQAVLLYCYELYVARLEQEACALPAPSAQLATEGELAELAASLESALRAAGALHAGRPPNLQPLISPLQRAGLTAKEFLRWNAALRALGKGAAGRTLRSGEG